MQKSIIAAAVLVSLSFLWMASGQSGPGKQEEQIKLTDAEVQELREQMAQQRLRIAQLEHASGQPTDPDAPVRTMVLVSICQSGHQGENAQEIARLQRQSDALMNTVNAKAEQTAADFGQPLYVGHVRGGVRGWRGGAGGRYGTTNVGSIGRQVKADRAIEQRYATLHGIKKRQLDAPKAADSEPRQILTGHDGDRIVQLETKHNLSQDLKKIDIGDTVTWTGTRISADGSSEAWEINAIHKVEIE